MVLSALKFIICVPFALLFACANESAVKNAVENKESASNSAKDTFIGKKITGSDTLSKIPKISLLKQSGFFWGHYKAKNQYLLNCGKKTKGLWKDSVPGFHYNYCLFNGAAEPKVRNKELSSGAMLVQFTVWMAGKKIGYYSDSIHEKLVLIKCNYRDPLLKGFNLVGESTKTVEKIFGKPDIKSLNEYYYFRENETLYISLRNFTVREFAWTKNAKNSIEKNK